MVIGIKESMYAVIESGSKQHKIKVGQIVRLETLPGVVGDKVEFDKVLLVSNGETVDIGAPYVNAKVIGEIVVHDRGDKIEIIKFRRRKHHMKRQGHRQNYTEVRIVEIKYDMMVGAVA